MYPSYGTGGNNADPRPTLSPQALNFFSEGIYLVLSRWGAIKTALENQWGGRHSLQKFHKLASKILSWFTSNSQELIYIDDFEFKLHKKMAKYFNVEFPDDCVDIEEVIEHLMFMYEECLEGNYELVERLRESVPGMHATSQSKRVIVDNEVESSDGEASDMMVDEPVAPTSSVEKPVLKEMPDEDKWTVVRPRRSRHKKTG